LFRHFHYAFGVSTIWEKNGFFGEFRG